MIDILPIQAALQSARLDREAADRANDEPAYYAAKARYDALIQQLDAAILSNDRETIDSMSSQINAGAFAPRFQVLGPSGDWWLVVDTRKNTIIRRYANKESAQIGAKEATVFTRQREQADCDSAKPINLSTRRR